MITGRIGRLAVAALLCGACCCFAAARAVDTITAGAVGRLDHDLADLYRHQNGFFDAVGIKIDPVSAVVDAIAQQVAAGSTNLTVGSGIVDPIRAIEKGADRDLADRHAGTAIRAAGEARDQSIKELTGKTISIGGAKTSPAFFERMLVPNGVKPSEVDYVFAGATSARLSALQSGAVDAAILTSPQNFYAEAAGFTNLGWTVNTPRNCRSPAARSTAPGPRPTSRCSTVLSSPTTRA